MGCSELFKLGKINDKVIKPIIIKIIIFLKFLEIKNNVKKEVKEKVNKTIQEETLNSQSSLKSGYSFVDQHRLEKLPNLIERLEYEIKKLENFLSDSALYLAQPLKFEKASTALIERQSKLKILEDEWLLLEEKASNFGEN